MSGVKQAGNQLGAYTVVRRQRVRPDRSDQAENQEHGANKGSSMQRLLQFNTSLASYVRRGLSTKNLIYKIRIV